MATPDRQQVSEIDKLKAEVKKLKSDNNKLDGALMGCRAHVAIRVSEIDTLNATNRGLTGALWSSEDKIAKLNAQAIKLRSKIQLLKNAAANRNRKRSPKKGAGGAGAQDVNSQTC